MSASWCPTRSTWSATRPGLGPGNRLADNETGLWLAEDAGRATVIGNRITDNVLDGVRMVRAPSALALRGNVIAGNRKAAFSVAAGGVAGRFAAGNSVAGHPLLERVRAPEAEGELRKGVVGQALER